MAGRHAKKRPKQDLTYVLDPRRPPAELTYWTSRAKQRAWEEAEGEEGREGGGGGGGIEAADQSGDGRKLRDRPTAESVSRREGTGLSASKWRREKEPGCQPPPQEEKA